MKRYTIAFCLTAFLFSCGEDKVKEEPRVAAAATTTPPPPPATSVPDSATAMKNWEAYMTPGEIHKMIGSWNGNWNGEISMWMAPGAPPSTSSGTMVNKTVLGGRYQQATYKGNYNGMPMEGMSTLAYDNAKKVFISTWIDNMGTGLMVGKGPWDPTTRTITLTGSMVDPTTGKDMDFRETYKIVDDNFHVMEMFAADPTTGKEFKTMEIKYTRKR